MLRCFVSYTQRDWSRYLPGLEFAFNNHDNDTTKYPPLYSEHGQEPLSFSDIMFSDESSSSKHTEKLIKVINEGTRLAKLVIEEANVRNGDIVESKRLEDEIRISDEFMLSTETLALKTLVQRDYVFRMKLRLFYERFSKFKKQNMPNRTDIICIMCNII